MIRGGISLCVWQRDTENSTEVDPSLSIYATTEVDPSLPIYATPPAFAFVTQLVCYVLCHLMLHVLFWLLKIHFHRNSARISGSWHCLAIQESGTFVVYLITLLLLVGTCLSARCALRIRSMPRERKICLLSLQEDVLTVVLKSESMASVNKTYGGILFILSDKSKVWMLYVYHNNTKTNHPHVCFSS